MNEKCCQVIVRGNVQGVFFRKYTKIKANNLDIKGFVKNELDNSVYIEAFGDDSKMKEFIEWCHHGPANASVEKVEVHEIPLKKFSSFEIVFY